MRQLDFKSLGYLASDCSLWGRTRPVAHGSRRILRTAGRDTWVDYEPESGWRARILSVVGRWKHDVAWVHLGKYSKLDVWLRSAIVPQPFHRESLCIWRGADVLCDDQGHKVFGGAFRIVRVPLDPRSCGDIVETWGINMFCLAVEMRAFKHLWWVFFSPADRCVSVS